MYHKIGILEVIFRLDRIEVILVYYARSKFSTAIKNINFKAYVGMKKVIYRIKKIIYWVKVMKIKMNEI